MRLCKILLLVFFLFKPWWAGRVQSEPTARSVGTPAQQDDDSAEDEPTPERLRAEEWAKTAQQGTHFPVVMNDFVFERIQFWLENEGRKRWLRNALQRMDELFPTFKKFADSYKLPYELCYLPVVETAYRNELWGGRFGGGIWALMPRTARRFGLVVDEKNDERLNVEKSTRAALRVLREDHRIFNDWLLAIRAYNEGAALVKRRIRRIHSKDNWAIEDVEPNHNAYVQNVLAVIILGKNRDVLAPL